MAYKFKFEEKLKASGLTEGGLTGNLGTKINKEIVDIREAAEDEDSSKEKINEGDEEICGMIVKYNTSLKMQAGKKAKQANAGATPPPAPAPVVTPVVVTPAEPPAPAPEPTPTPEPAKEGGKIGIGSIFVGIGILIAAGFGIKAFMNNK